MRRLCKLSPMPSPIGWIRTRGILHRQVRIMLQPTPFHSAERAGLLGVVELFEDSADCFPSAGGDFLPKLLFKPTHQIRCFGACEVDDATNRAVIETQKLVRFILRAVRER